MITTFSTSDICTAPPRLHVRSRFVDDVEPGPGFPFESGLPTTVEQTLELLPTSAFSCWVRDTSGLIGFGRTLRIRARGRDRFTELSDAWKTITGAATIEDEVDHYRRRVEAERQSQLQRTDQEADEARVKARDIV